MGVSRYFRKLVQRWPEIVFPAEALPIDNLYLDFNCLIHPCAQRVLASLKGKAPLEDSDVEIAIFQTVGEYFLHIVRKFEPKKLIFVSIDGVAPLAKQLQQRDRRYKSAKIREKSDSLYRSLGLNEHASQFDTNAITPGSAFMVNLNSFLETLIRKEISSPRTILSGSNVPGEGEHKITTHIRKTHTDGETDCVYGLDADLIFLTLICNVPNMYLLRERVYFSDQTENSLINTAYQDMEFDFLSLDKMRNCLVKETHKITRRHYTATNLVRDYTFMCFLLGNDFLPHLPSLNIKQGGLDQLYGLYLRLLQSQDKHLVLADMTINTKFMFEMINGLANSEDRTLQDETQSRHMRPFQRRFSPDASKSERENRHAAEMYDLEVVAHSENDTVHMGKRGWKTRYYNYYFGVSPGRMHEYCDTRRSVAEMYYRGLAWVWQYYTGGLTTWDWAYTHAAGPTVSDLLEFYQDINKIKFTKTTPCKPFDQLMSVLPPSSGHLLPQTYAIKMKQIDSPIMHYLSGGFFVFKP